MDSSPNKVVQPDYPTHESTAEASSQSLSGASSSTVVAQIAKHPPNHSSNVAASSGSPAVNHQSTPFSWKDAIALAMLRIGRIATLDDIRDWIEANIAEKSSSELKKSSVSSILSQYKGKTWRVTLQDTGRSFARSRIQYELIRNEKNVVYFRSLLLRFKERFNNVDIERGLNSLTVEKSFNNSIQKKMVDDIAEQERLNNPAGPVIPSIERREPSLAQPGYSVFRLAPISNPVGSATQTLSSRASGTKTLTSAVSGASVGQPLAPNTVDNESEISSSVLGTPTPVNISVPASRSATGNIADLSVTRHAHRQSEVENKASSKTIEEIAANISFPSRQALLRDFEEPPLVKPHKIPRKGALSALVMNQTSHAYMAHRMLCKQLEEEHIQKKKKEIIDAKLAEMAKPNEPKKPFNEGGEPDPRNCPPPSGLLARLRTRASDKP